MTTLINEHQTDLKKSHLLFKGCLFLMLCLVFVRYSLQIDFPRELFLPIAALMACFGDRDEIMALIVCCIPLHTSIQYAYVVLICLVVYVAKYGKDIRINLSFIPFFLIVIWELLHCFDTLFSPVQLVHVLLPFALYLVLIGSKWNYNYPYIARVYSITLVGMCTVLLGKLLFLANFNWLSALSGLRRLGLDTTELAVEGAELNPNTLGIMCVLGITSLFQLRLSGQGQKRDWLLIIVLLGFGLLTSSKTYLACLLVMIVCLIFSQSKSFKKTAKLLLLLGICVLLAVIVVSNVLPDLFEFYLKRFQDEDFTTGRDVLMVRYHEWLWDNPKILLGGIGLQSFNEKVLNRYMVAEVVPHNGIQELVIAWGLIGLILFSILIAIMLWYSHVKLRTQTLLNYIPLIILFVKIQAGQMLTSSYTMLVIAFAYLSLCHDFSAKIKSDE